MTPHLVVRADAGPAVGGGHVMRCLAIAEEWRVRGGLVTVVLPKAGRGFAERLERVGLAVRFVGDPEANTAGAHADLEATRRIVEEVQASHVIVDGYRFSSALVAGLRGESRRVLVVDDNRDYDTYPIDFVLNPNRHARADAYPETGAELLLGGRYTPIRLEFRFPPKLRPSFVDRGEHLLVTLGAADPEHTTGAVLRAIERLPVRPASVRVVIGPAFPHAAALRELAATIEPVPEVAEQPTEMASLMCWADACVSGAGSTTWELALMGVPTIAVVLAENQRAVARSLADDGMALAADGAEVRADPAKLVPSLERLLGDAALRRQLVDRARTAVDGEGAARVVMRLMDAPFRLRGVRPEDEAALLSWVNDPQSRRMSFTERTITSEEHARWFGRHLVDEDSRCFVVVDSYERGAGMVRFTRRRGVDHTPEEIEIAIGLAPEVRGRGWASRIIREACALYAALEGPAEVTAFIRPENAPSIRAFSRAGFEIVGDTERLGIGAKRLVSPRRGSS